MDINQLVNDCIDIITLFMLVNINREIKINGVLISTYHKQTFHRDGLNSFVLSEHLFSWVMKNGYWIYKYDRTNNELSMWDGGWQVTNDKQKLVAYEYLHTIYVMLLNLITFRTIQLID